MATVRQEHTFFNPDFYTVVLSQYLLFPMYSIIVLAGHTCSDGGYIVYFIYTCSLMWHG